MEYIRPFDSDPDLLTAVPDGDRRHARAFETPAVRIERGAWAGDLGSREDLGVLVLEGLLTRNVDVASTRSREILGSGDIIRPWDDDGALNPVPSRTTWTVLEPTTFTVLDSRFRSLTARWPDLGTEVLHRVLRRSRWLTVLLAIANLRGIRDRVLLLLWHLAGNWGRVTPDGTLVPFQLTHELIADLIGARRPSVTTAISAMERDGILVRIEGGWLLRGDPPQPDSGDRASAG